MYIFAGTDNGVWKRALSDFKTLTAPEFLRIESYENSTNTFNIGSNTSWNLSCSETWLEVSTESGSGDATITLTAQENSDQLPRTAIISISGGSAGDLTVIVMQDGNGIPTGIIKTENNNITVYPSPVSHVLFISGLSNSIKISIYDMHGNLILSNYHIKNQFDVIGLSTGIYIIEIENGGGAVARKFVKL